MMNAAAGLGPHVTPLATFHVTPVCDDGEQTGAHKVIFGSWVVSNAWRTVASWWNCKRAGSKCKHPLQPPSMSWVQV